MRPHFREDCAELLRRAGFRPAGRGRGVRYARLGRWLVREDQWRPFLTSGRVRLADLRRLRLLAFDDGAQPARIELLLVREDGRPKVAMFALREARKDVRYLHALDFEAEQRAMDYFATGGIPVPPRFDVCAAEQSYSQLLVCDPLTVNPRPLPARDLLIRLASAGTLQFLDGERFMGEVIHAAHVVRQFLPAALYTKIEAVLSLFAARRIPELGGRVPLMRCHGDLAPGNVLHGDDGILYLNDLDRSFVAGPLYDACYLALGSTLSRAEAFAHQGALAEVPALAGAIGAADRAAYPWQMTVLDLVRFLAMRYERLRGGADAICQYSIAILGRALRECPQRG